MRFVLMGFNIFLSCYSVLAQPTAKSGDDIHWYYNFDEAKEEALDKNKYVLVYFSGSDWCKPCIQLREKILSTNACTQFVNERFVMLQADFPRLKKNQLSKEQIRHNEALAERYNKQGSFPLLVIIDQSGKVVDHTGFREETPEAFVARVKTMIDR